MELQVGVKALLQNKEGKYLLLKRSKEKYPDVQGDLWDIVGGRINPGTPLIENLKREIEEETKLLLLEEPKLVAAQDILKTPGKHVVRLTYTGQVDGEVQLDDDHEAYKWCTPEELKSFFGLDRFFTELIETKKIVL